MRGILLVALLLGLGGSIDPNEFECEEAVKHLKDCCGSSLPEVHCGEGCGDVQLTLQNATCLRNASCDALQRNGACDDPTGVQCQ